MNINKTKVPYCEPAIASPKGLRFASLLIFTICLGLSGCDLESLLADPKVAQREAEGKAIGGSCRQGLRAIEDCFAMNERASKAAIFSGWKEMDQYMRDNKIEGVEPKGVAPAKAQDKPNDQDAAAKK
jgi:hypothetical protein